jgi:hypothetical protein
MKDNSSRDAVTAGSILIKMCFYQTNEFDGGFFATQCIKSTLHFDKYHIFSLSFYDC